MPPAEEGSQPAVDEQAQVERAGDRGEGEQEAKDAAEAQRERSVDDQVNEAEQVEGEPADEDEAEENEGPASHVDHSQRLGRLADASGCGGVNGVDEQARDEIVEALIERLRVEGVPEGTWLVDIAQARAALREADALLLRLERALTRDAGSRPPSPPAL